ncbi:hypothetical protein AA106556_1994 [Neokomagataea tanensis NBRC 106556]|uniref:Uncharacterized protein n=1 Tax=Neokomagataea tanensis NBRC 106556 TaxID=1223519 RepID=A0ABQ0QLE8_9PROT|nr:hypothetical protein AA106556_1994 [Neokomagataea tanensis NBRC 106556]
MICENFGVSGSVSTFCVCGDGGDTIFDSEGGDGRGGAAGVGDGSGVVTFGGSFRGGNGVGLLSGGGGTACGGGGGGGGSSVGAFSGGVGAGGASLRTGAGAGAGFGAG